MTILQVYQRYKHLDQLLSDPIWVEDDLKGQIIHKFWKAIKTRALVEAATQTCTDKLEPLDKIEVIPKSMEGTLII